MAAASSPLKSMTTQESGQESRCGWCKDLGGVWWLFTPGDVRKATMGSDAAIAKRAFDAMMTMKKIDVAAIEKACKGE